MRIKGHNAKYSDKFPMALETGLRLDSHMMMYGVLLSSPVTSPEVGGQRSIQRIDQPSTFDDEAVPDYSRIGGYPEDNLTPNLTGSVRLHPAIALPH